MSVGACVVRPRGRTARAATGPAASTGSGARRAAGSCSVGWREAPAGDARLIPVSATPVPQSASVTTYHTADTPPPLPTPPSLGSRAAAPPAGALGWARGRRRRGAQAATPTSPPPPPPPPMTRAWRWGGEGEGDQARDTHPFTRRKPRGASDTSEKEKYIWRADADRMAARIGRGDPRARPAAARGRGGEPHPAQPWGEAEVTRAGGRLQGAPPHRSRPPRRFRMRLQRRHRGGAAILRHRHPSATAAPLRRHDSVAAAPLLRRCSAPPLPRCTVTAAPPSRRRVAAAAPPLCRRRTPNRGPPTPPRLAGRMGGRPAVTLGTAPTNGGCRRPPLPSPRRQVQPQLHRHQ